MTRSSATSIEKFGHKNPNTFWVHSSAHESRNNLPATSTEINICLSVSWLSRSFLGFLLDIEAVYNYK